MMKRVSLWSVFWNFFVAGATAFGGPAMIPGVRAQIVERGGLLSRQDFALGLGLCQMLPGGTLIQLSAYTGLCLRGVPGAVAGYIGFSAPAFLMMLGLSMVYARTTSSPLVAAVFAGLKVVVLAVCLMASLDFLKKFARGWLERLFMALAAGLFLAGVGAIPIVAGAALGGLLLLDGGQASPQTGGGVVVRTTGVVAGLVAVILAGLAALFLTDRGLFDLAVSMIKVDMLAFGGFGCFPVMFAEVVEHRGWMDARTFIDGMALAQVTPGPVLQASAFVGYLTRGVAGAVVASVAVFVFSFVVVLMAGQFREKVLGSTRARRALAGVLATLGGMIVAVSVSLAGAVDWNWSAWTMLAASLAAMQVGVPTPWIVLAGGAVSLLLF